ncbi:MAG: hypothetical protein ACJAV7_001947 [Flavobacteriales bacterium]|jgi:hypothetical protein
MTSGNKVLLGSYTDGIGIAIALVTRVRKNNSQSVQNSYYTVYFNPEISAALQQHAVTLNDASREQLLMGFEDINRE